MNSISIEKRILNIDSSIRYYEEMIKKSKEELMKLKLENENPDKIKDLEINIHKSLSRIKYLESVLLEYIFNNYE